jgi:citrate lyase subunit beta/citryl-CoA lyase/(S)-citramalyl-CoA lyase
MPSPRRSLLFAPGSRPELFDKALAAGADLACLDLEDAVAPPLKDQARGPAIAWLAAAHPGDPAERVVRINGLKTRAGLADLLAVAAAKPAAGLVFLPKVDSPAELRLADAILTEAGSGAALMALIESVEGLENVFEICRATPRLQLVMFGAADLSAELAVPMEHEPLLYARSRTVHAAKRAGIGVLDVPVLDFRDLERVAREAATAKALGFTGKGAIHPSGLGPIHAAFTPSAEEVARARAVIAAFEASPTGLVVLDGKLIEAPVVRAMRRILDTAGGGA